MGTSLNFKRNARGLWRLNFAGVPILFVYGY